MKKITLMLFVVMLTLSAHATTYYVTLTGAGLQNGTSWVNAYAGEAGITSAIAAAAAAGGGDIWVAAGTYPHTTTMTITNKVNIYGGFAGTEDALSKRIKGANPWDYSNATIINGGTTQVFTLTGNLVDGAIIDGFTFSGNTSTTQGSIALIRGNVTVQNCKLTNNTTSHASGGTIMMNGGTLSYCYIYNNTATAASINGGITGGVYSGPGTSGLISTVDHCLIDKNAGGGLRAQGVGTTNIDACTFRRNFSVTTNGGSTLASGGAIYTNTATNRITNCLIYNNSGSNLVYLNGGEFTNNTICNNEGIVRLASATLSQKAHNNIFWGNLNFVGGSAVSLTCAAATNTGTTLVQYNLASFAVGTNTKVTSTANNTTTPINFVSPSSDVGYNVSDAVVNAADWRIQSGSSAIAFGNNSLIPGGITTDFLGAARVQNTTVDAGAIEFPYAYTLSSGTTNASSMIDNPSCAVTVNGIGTILNIDANKTFASLTVAPGAQVTLNNTKTLNPGTFTLQSDATGTATFVDNNATGAAITATVQQYLPSARNWYISSPIVTAQVPVASTYSYWNEPTGVWASAVAGAEQTMGKGYIARPVSAVTLAYAGTLNNNQTPISIGLTRTATVTKEGFNLLGNPFPSYLNWKLVYEDAENTTAGNVDPTIWYRTKNAAGTYVFATYNAVDNLGSTINEDPKDVATGNIPPMQGFWVRVNNGQTAGTLKLKNSMRAHKGTQLQADAISYNDAIRRAPSVINPTQVLRLQVSNAANSDEAIVLFNSNAVDNFDAYDSPKMMNNNAVIPEIYTTVENEKVVINGFKELKSNVEIPLGFVPGSATSFTLKATQFSNFEKGTQVLLIDKADGSRTIDITDGTAYQFYADNSIPASKRFSLMFKLPSSETNLKNLSVNEVLIYRNANREIVLRISGEKNVENTVSGFNALGQKLFTQKVTQSLTVLKNFQGLSGVYFVTVNTTGGKSTQKIILD